MTDSNRIGRGTTLHAGMSIAYATLDHLLRESRCRTLFATHYHELANMLTSPDGAIRPGVGFFCTDVEEGVSLLFNHGRPANKVGCLTDERIGRGVQLPVQTQTGHQLHFSCYCKHEPNGAIICHGADIRVESRKTGRDARIILTNRSRDPRYPANERIEHMTIYHNVQA